MSTADRTCVALLITLFTVVLGLPFASPDPQPIAWPTPRSAAPMTMAPTAPGMLEIGRLHDAPIDLYGNEVTDAIATYKLDPTGVLYEEHSPNTELPRLGIPKS